MRIITQGQLPEEVVYTTTCSYCTTKFEFVAREAKQHDGDSRDQRERAYLSIDCPTCKRICSTPVISPSEYLRKKQASDTANSDYIR